MIPENLRFFLYLNPVGLIFVGLHEALISGKWPVLQNIVISLSWTLFFSFFAAWFQRVQGMKVVERI